MTYRDVWVVDAANVPVAIYNLSASSLATPANYDALRALFVDAMGQ